MLISCLYWSLISPYHFASKFLDFCVAFSSSQTISYFFLIIISYTVCSPFAIQAFNPLQLLFNIYIVFANLKKSSDVQI